MALGFLACFRVGRSFKILERETAVNVFTSAGERTAIRNERIKIQVGYRYCTIEHTKLRAVSSDNEEHTLHVVFMFLVSGAIGPVTGMKERIENIPMRRSLRDRVIDMSRKITGAKMIPVVCTVIVSVVVKACDIIRFGIGIVSVLEMNGRPPEGKVFVKWIIFFAGLDEQEKGNNEWIFHGLFGFS